MEQKPRLTTNAILDYVRSHPGQTAWDIATGMQRSTGTISSIAHKLVVAGRLARILKPGKVRNAWHYFPIQ